MNLASAVANLQREMEFYREQFKECREIIQQLNGETLPGGYKYIHPYDVAVMLNSEDVSQTVDMSKLPVAGARFEIQLPDGTRLRQSCNIPPKTKDIR